MQEVVIAVGSNVGDRMANIDQGLSLLRQAGVQVFRHGCLYESAPAYFTEQPFFLNSAILAHTSLVPHDLLRVLKEIEARLGRDFGGKKNGPRPLDLDILFYGTHTINTNDLQIPHPRMLERPFVLAPVVDLLGADGDRPFHWSTHPFTSGGICQRWKEMGSETIVGEWGLKRVLPLAGTMWQWDKGTSVMGILNVTPDSFSDGGQFVNVENAIEQAHKMASEGAEFIDVGGQSTRPGADRLSTEEELSRTIPVVKALASDTSLKGVFISVDTFDSVVAEAAVTAGAHLVNDVSGGLLDPKMPSTVAKLRVPYVIMHMRGDPKTMTSKENTRYSQGLCRVIGEETAERCRIAEMAGVPAWRILFDPGLGFAKNVDQNVEIIRELPKVREMVASKSTAVGFMPLLLGPSRKGFLGKIIGQTLAEQRDWATCAAAVAGVAGGANIIRAHNVKAVRDAVRVADAIWRQRKTW